MQPTLAPASPTPTSPAPDDSFARELNDLLVGTFRSIERFEERSLRSFAGFDLSVNEAHVVDVVGRGGSGSRGITVSQVAAALGVRVPTATAAVNRLVQKGLARKVRSADDLRTVHVRLTRAGRRAFRLHALFHRRMVDAVAGDIDPGERAQLACGIRKLKAFFEKAANGDAYAPGLVHNSQDGDEGAPMGIR